MAYLLTPTLEVRTSREFLSNQPTSQYVYGWIEWLVNFDYSGFWSGYDTNYLSNTIGATATNGSGSGATASRRWSLPAGRYHVHYHIETKVDSSVSNSATYWTNEMDENTSYRNYFTSNSANPNYIAPADIHSSVKQKNVQFCSSRSNTSIIEANRSYVTFDHWLEWDHGGGSFPTTSNLAFNGNTQGFVSVEDFYYILRRVR